MGTENDDARLVATAFVDLVGAYDRKKKCFPNEATACSVMLALVRSAGFAATRVAGGLLRGDYLEQDGSRTGETYAINTFPYKVVSGRENDSRATEWLNDWFHPTYGNALGYKRSQLIENLKQAVLDRRPLPLIVLTDIGDALREYPRERVTDKGTRDEDTLGGCVGVHDECNGFMDRSPASKTHDALGCRACNLRVGIPKSVKTYGDLRRHFAQFNP